MDSQDQSKSLLAQVQAAIKQQSPIAIEGGSSKGFYGYQPSPGFGRLDVSGHRGVIDY